MLGQSLLVAPVVEAGAKTSKVSIPKPATCVYKPDRNLGAEKEILLSLTYTYYVYVFRFIFPPKRNGIRGRTVSG